MKDRLRLIPQILTCQPGFAPVMLARLSSHYMYQIYSLRGKCMNTRLLCPSKNRSLLTPQVSGGFDF